MENFCKLRPLHRWAVRLRLLFIIGMAWMQITRCLADLKFWSTDPMARIHEGADPPANASGEVFIVAPRNGVASGLLIVSSTTPLNSLSVKASPFDNGLSAPQIRYGLFNKGQSPKYFDGLSDKFMPEARTVVIWLTINVPRDVRPGVSTARLQVNGQLIPVKLKVTPFTLPDRKDYTIWVSTTQSPETLALHYDVRPFSDAHWNLIERSLELQGQLGDKVCYIPVIGRTWFGNEYGLVHFRKQGSGLIPDFTVMEKYLRLYIKHCGPPRAVILNLWEPYMVANKDPSIRNKVWLTVVASPGQYEVIEFPRYPEYKPLWAAILNGAREVLKRLQLDPAIMRLGIGSDARVPDADIAFFEEIASDLRWAVFTHGYGGEGKNWSYGEFPDNGIPEGATIRGGWDRFDPRRVVMNTVRDCHNDQDAAFVFRGIADRSVGVHHNRPSIGLARVGLDLWPVATTGQKKSPIIGRFPENRANRLYRHATYSITTPGPDGALATQRFEMLREGVQDTEARIQLERALKQRSIPNPLRERVESLLQQRNQWLRDLRNPPSTLRVYQLVEQLLDLAGEVQQLP